MASFLIVDDERNIRSHLATFLRGLGHDVETASSATEALERLDRREFGAVMSDVRMTGIDGIELLREIRRRRPDAIVVLMTAYATVPQAVAAVKAGAYDYLAKPFSLDQVRLAVDRVLEVQNLRRENRRLRRATDEDVLLESGSPAMQEALATARRAASSEATILLTGESGTGKTVLARQVHAWSRRARGPFVTIACATLAEHLLESELFGHVKGAFTGAWTDKPGRIEGAASGTVFLDEVGELTLELQKKLLRFLEERRFERVGGTATLEVDARVLAATHRDLESGIAAGRFREDLFFRLNVIAIRVPALRERKADLPALSERLLARAAAKHDREPPIFSAEALRVLERYDWPGNVRELSNAIERAVVLSPGGVIEPGVFPDRLLAPVTRVESGSGSLEDLERVHIERVLAESVTLEDAASRLGINVTTLWRKRKRYGLE